MNTLVPTFYERRKSILSIDFTDRRKVQRRRNEEATSLEKRRLISQIRRHEREMIEVPVCLQVDGKELTGHTHNISLGGLLIIINSSLAVGTPITAQFSFGESFCFLNIVGQVVFCSPRGNDGSSQYVIGIKFSATRDIDQKILSTAIQVLRGSPSTEEKSSVSIIVAKDNVAPDVMDFHLRTSKSLEEPGIPAVRKSTVHASKIIGWGSYLPPQEITAQEINKLFKAEGYKNVGEVVEALTGIKSRRYADPELYPSDLAAIAAQDALNNAGMDANDLDVIIFCGISHDFDEPATANVIKEKIDAKNAYVFDMTNACNGFVTALDSLDAMIASGRCESGMVVTGERALPYLNWDPKTREDFKLSIFGYTVGEAGGAAVMTRTRARDTRGIKARWFSSESNHWRLALAGTLEGANSYNKFFRSDGLGLEKISIKTTPRALQEITEILGWTISDIDLVVPHQIPVSLTDNLYHKALGISYDKLIHIFPRYGNLATASMPVAVCEAIKLNRVKENDKILLAGVAAGFSIGFIGLVF
ncbi:MAG: PilZ domain-containing protein [Candidatus Manganitrophus sp.]|nr:PilZ domain-containing protein [Candidatus Manganitrophus sp.]MDC4227167.1 PilZ domain-containing protein [Candidatus Manganitrophus sp.]WDT71436.1 MAG: PilZ domain-containing protein [Candidatus Manganitrophus sp.]WDT76311.1 MAG: PilZ domain-containing protein [Candidatus Manganitrophus sp.]WDT81231.1 MAG: PilZ domain-containing protein [Candidatus Manganitrophus sp.]